MATVEWEEVKDRERWPSVGGLTATRMMNSRAYRPVRLDDDIVAVEHIESGRVRVVAGSRVDEDGEWRVH